VPEDVVGYFSMARTERELDETFGRTVGFRTPFELSRHFRSEVIEGGRRTTSSLRTPRA
jgi:hypothetical protein